MATANEAWVVYLLRSRDAARTYVGVTNHLAQRLAQHNGRVAGGASSTRAGRPWHVARVHGPYETRAEAQRVENAWKRRRGEERLDWRPAQLTAGR